MKKILTFKLFEKIYLNEEKNIHPENKYSQPLSFYNKDEATRSVNRIEEMLKRNEIDPKDARIAAYVISKRAELHKSYNKSINEGRLVWEDYLNKLDSKYTI